MPRAVRTTLQASTVARVSRWSRSTCSAGYRWTSHRQSCGEVDQVPPTPLTWDRWSPL